MADWVHCNRCSTRYDSNSTIYVTTCGHMQCDRCTAKSDKNKCAVCKSPCGIVPLNNSLPAEMQPFFLSPTQILDKAKQISMFQNRNKMALLKTVTGKCNYVKGELIKAYKMIHKAKKETIRLQMQLKNITKASGSTSMSSGAPAIFPSSTNSFISSAFPNQQNSIPNHSASFVSSTSTPMGSATWINHSNLPPSRIVHRKPSTAEHCFMTPSQSSIGNNTMEESFVGGAGPKIANSTGPHHRRPNVMMSMSRLNKPR